MTQEQQHHNTSLTCIHYHFVWVPRRRRKVLIDDLAERLKTLLYASIADLNCTILALEIMPDPVHLFLNAPPTLAPDQIMFRLKGYTARILRKEFPYLMKMPSMWTRFYYCSTAGQVSSETVRRYIENQKTR